MFGLIPWKRSRRQELTTQWNDPWENTLASLRQEMDRLFQRFLSPGWENQAWSWETWFEGLQDQGDHYLVRMAAPGFEPEEFDISVSGNRLVVRAEHKPKKEEGNGGFHYGSLHQVVTLPEGVDLDHIEARYHNGVLQIRIPKSEEARPKRIPVKA